MATSEAQKRANQKYRELHREEAKLCTKKFRENNPDYKAVYYLTNIEIQRTHNRLYQAKFNAFKREFLRLANINI
jgi:hypothetical protein